MDLSRLDLGGGFAQCIWRVKGRLSFLTQAPPPLVSACSWTPKERAREPLAPLGCLSAPSFCLAERYFQLFALAAADESLHRSAPSTD